MKTKKQIVEEKIALNQEEIYAMEIVRDFNTGIDNPEARVQVDAANDKIKKAEVQITWLKKYLESCE